MLSVYISIKDAFLQKLIAESLAQAEGLCVVPHPGDANVGIADIEAISLPSLHWQTGMLPVRLSALAHQLKMLGAENSQVLLAADCVFYPAARRINADGNFIELTEKETWLLMLLATADEAGMTREALLSEVWSYGANVDTHTLETHIHRLRGKLAGIAGLSDRLETIGEGYRWH